MRFSAVLASNFAMPTINVSVAQLRRSFNRLRDEARKDNREHNYLLLFYATECGLKSAVLREKRLRSTSDLDQPSHDLSALVKELKLPRKVVSSQFPVTFRLRNESSPRFDCRYAHEAWRYGADVEPKDELELVQWLREICAHLDVVL